MAVTRPPVCLAVRLRTGVWNVTTLEEGALDGDGGTVLTVKLGLAVGSVAAAAAFRRSQIRRPAVPRAGTTVETGVVTLVLGSALDAVLGGHG